MVVGLLPAQISHIINKGKPTGAISKVQTVFEVLMNGNVILDWFEHQLPQLNIQLLL